MDLKRRHMFLFFFEGERVSGFTLANYVLMKASEPLNNMKLQRILYYIQGSFLSAFDRPLFPDEIHAWKFGPVVPTVYYRFSAYGSDPLPVLEAQAVDEVIAACELKEIELIDRVIAGTSALSVKELNDYARSEAPWINATNNGREIRLNAVIRNDDIKYFFKNGSKIRIY